MARKKLTHLPKEPLSQEDQERLKNPPHESLQRLANAKGDGTDWYNVCYRILNGAYVAPLIYTKDVQALFQEAFALMEKLYDCQKAFPYGTWTIPIEDHLVVLNALELVDQITAEVDRQTQIHAHRKTFARMMYYKKRHDKFMAQQQKQQPHSQAVEA